MAIPGIEASTLLCTDQRWPDVSGFVASAFDSPGIPGCFRTEPAEFSFLWNLVGCRAMQERTPNIPEFDDERRATAENLVSRNGSRIALYSRISRRSSRCSREFNAPGRSNGCTPVWQLGYSAERRTLAGEFRDRRALSDCLYSLAVTVDPLTLDYTDYTADFRGNVPGLCDDPFTEFR